MTVRYNLCYDDTLVESRIVYNSLDTGALNTDDTANL